MPAGRFFGSRGRLGQFENVEAQIGAGHAEHAVGERNVLRRHFEQVGGKVLALGDDGARRLVERGAAVGAFFGLAIVMARGFTPARLTGALFCLAAAAHTLTQLPASATGLGWGVATDLGAFGHGRGPVLGIRA